MEIEKILYQLTDGDSSNSGRFNGFWLRRERHNQIPTHRVLCMIHALCSVNRSFIEFVVEGTTSETSFDNSEMKTILENSKTIHLQEIVNFKIIERSIKFDEFFPKDIKDCDDNASKNIQLEHRLKKRIIHNCTSLLSENFLYCLKLEKKI